MTDVGKIFDALNVFCPFEVHEPWDNVGILVGERAAEVRKAAVVLDITADAVKQAHVLGAQIVVSHHPVIFNAIKALEPSDPVYLLASFNMNAVCAHTNLDCADGGVNDVLARCLELENVEKVLSNEAQTPILRTGELKSELSTEAFARYVVEKLGCHVRFADGKRIIKKVMLCGGAGGEFFADAAAYGCEALVTGEIKHHEFLAASACGVTAVEAGHFETETPVVDVLKCYLEQAVPEVEFFTLPVEPPTRFV